MVSLYDRPEAATAERIVGALVGAVRPATRVLTAASHTIPSFGGAGGPGAANTPGGFHSFEHRWALAEAFAFHRWIGKARVEARIHGLTRRLKAGLASVPGVRVFTLASDALSAGIVCFEMAGLSPGVVVDRLDGRRIVATLTPYTPTYAWLAPGLLNTPADVDRAVAAVRAIAP